MMTKIRIIVPTIKNDDNGFNLVIGIINEVTSNPKNNFDFDFSKCSRLDHHGVVALGGLARYVNYQNSTFSRSISGLFNSNVLATAGVMFDVNSMSDLIGEKLISNNFLSHFTQLGFEGYSTGDYIGYREHTTVLDEDNIAEHLNDQWISDEKVSLSPALKESVVSRIFEIFMNAYGHGAAIQEVVKLGVYSCGQYDKKDKTLNLSVLDFGPGIVNNVMKHKQEIKNDLNAMKWALTRGNSTGTDSIRENMPRGLGFDLLAEFVKINEGEMRIFSNGVCAKLKNGNDFVVERSKYDLSGTLVSIKINCDDKHYKFKSEITDGQFKFF
jgi:hypothetical protein